MSFVDPSRGSIIENTHITQLTGLLRGDESKGQLVRLYRVEDSANYANIFGNVDTTNGLAVKIQYGAVASPTTLATFAKAATTLQSNDGTRSLVISNSGVAITAPSASFTVNGQTFNRGIAVYNVLDHGIVTGTNSTNAAANTSALQTLWTTVATAGGGTIYFPACPVGTHYPLNATVLDHALTYSVPMNIVGEGGQTKLVFYGTTGPFLDIGNASTSPVAYGHIRDFTIYHDGTPTSGATLQLGYVNGYQIANVDMLTNSVGGEKNPLICVRLHRNATALKFLHCKWGTRGDLATLGGLVPRTVEFAQESSVAATVGGIEFHGVEFGGVTGSGGSTGLRFINTATIDTVVFSGLCLVKDHDTGIRFGAGANTGTVANLMASGLTVDQISGVAVLYAPEGTGNPHNHQYTGCWFGGTTASFYLNTTGGGSLNNVTIADSYMSGPTSACVTLVGAMSDIGLVGNRIVCEATTAGNVAVDVGDGANAITDVAIIGNRIRVANGTVDGVIRIDSLVDAFTVAGNQMRGGADADGLIIGGALSASRVADHNSWIAA